MLNLRTKLTFFRQIFRYLIVGGLATLLNYLIFIFLYSYAGVYYIFASASGYVISVLAGYYFNKRWTFNHATGGNENLLKYFGVYLSSLLLSIPLLHFFVETILIPAAWANILTIGFTVCTNFLGLKYLVFKKE